MFDSEGRWTFDGVTYTGDWKIEKTLGGVEIKDDCPCWAHTREARKVPRSQKPSTQKPAAGGAS